VHEPATGAYLSYMNPIHTLLKPCFSKYMLILTSHHELLDKSSLVGNTEIRIRTFLIISKTYGKKTGLYIKIQRHTGKVG
jgi:hypothetical protein